MADPVSYTLASPMPGHTPTLADGPATPVVSPWNVNLIVKGGTVLTCECGWAWYTKSGKVDGSYALCNTAYQGHTLAVQSG
jgi:hypothetical protein